MENKLLAGTINNLPELIRHTHLNISLEGWPATVTVISCCLTLVAVVAIRTSQQEAVPQLEGAVSFCLDPKSNQTLHLTGSFLLQ